MLKKSYRLFIIIGICIGVATGVFFICSLQNQLETTAERNEARRQQEQNGKIYLTDKVLDEKVLMHSSMMHPEAYKKIASLIPQDWLYAPVAVKPEPPQIGANNTQIADTSLIYTTEAYFGIKQADLLEGDFSGCAASRSFMEEYGVNLGDEITLEGEKQRITGVFELTREDSVDARFFLRNTGSLLLLPYAAHAEEEGLFLQLIDIQKPEDLALADFEAQLAQLQEEINLALPDPERQFVVKSSGALFLQLEQMDMGAAVYLGIFFMTFLGEFIAGVNIMHLASAGILENRRTIGIRLAAGASFGNLFREFLGEIALLCAKGTLLGVALAAVLVYAMNTYMGSFVFLFNGTTVLLSILVTGCVALLSAWFPFRYVLRRQPAVLLSQGA